jgi:hypothetical protein
MPPIASYTEFHLRLLSAVAALKVYEERYPDELPLNGLRRQLEALDEWSAGGKPPTVEQKNQLNFGLLASYYLAPIDRELENELHELPDYLRFWRENQR